MARYLPDGSATATNLAECAVKQWNVRVVCRCGHAVVIDGIALWWDFERKGRNQAMTMVARHLYCRRCFDRGRGRVPPRAVEITRQRGDMVGLPCPGRQVWKQLVARYRT